MKKVLILTLILTFVVSSLAFGAVKKSKTTVTTMKVAAPTPAAAAPASAGGVSIAPKLTMATGDYNGLAIGVESYFYNVMPGFQLGAEGNYKLQVNNISWIQIGGIGRYMIPMEGSMFLPYVGGGLNYNIYNINIAGAGSASGIGFKLYGGADIPVAGVGIFFGTVGYGSQSITYNNVSASGGGLYLEGGYRFVI